MPYASNQDLPENLQRILPPHAQDIFRSAFNATLQNYAKREPLRREDIARRVAWAAVKKKYRKEGAIWVPLSGH
jgi:cation transport regulator